MNEPKARAKMELVKSGDAPVNSGVVPSTTAASVSGSISAERGIPEGLKRLAPGTLLQGKYLVGEVIGLGAFGIVYEAKNIELDEKVALKMIRPDVAVDAGMVRRFAREAKSAAVIKSEYVASVYDVGMHGEDPYIVMEYLEGKDLAAILEESGRMDARSAVEYALQVCEALAVAHAKGIIHRDIKPENLLLTERSGGMRIVKVLDFGISKAALTGSIFGDDLPIVKTVNLMGTPLYMSPEQFRRTDTVDVRSDIWSLGMVLYQIIAGHPAFTVLHALDDTGVLAALGACGGFRCVHHFLAVSCFCNLHQRLLTGMFRRRKPGFYLEFAGVTRLCRTRRPDRQTRKPVRSTRHDDFTRISLGRAGASPEQDERFR